MRRLPFARIDRVDQVIALPTFVSTLVTLPPTVFIAVMAALVFYIHWRFVSSPMKAVLQAIRDDEPVAMSLGIDVVKTRIVVFAWLGIAGPGPVSLDHLVVRRLRPDRPASDYGA